jgi:hypothetical protein
VAHPSWADCMEGARVWCDAKGLRRLTIPDQLKMATAYCANGRSSWYSGGGDSACTYIAHPLPDVLLCKLHYCSCNLAAPSLNYPSISISILHISPVAHEPALHRPGHRQAAEKSEPRHLSSATPPHCQLQQGTSAQSSTVQVDAVVYAERCRSGTAPDLR